MFKQDDIEELLLQENQKKVCQMANKILDILSNDRDAAYMEALNGKPYMYPKEHLWEVPKGLSPFRIIREVQKLLERRYPTEVGYLQIKQETAYSCKNGVLSRKRKCFRKKVPAISFRWNRRKK
ncbi:MAG: hypothetical protein ACI4VE_06400 [Clostridia bacterium]